MSQLVAVVFDDSSEAAKARAAIRELQRSGQLTLQDAATVERGPDGKLRVNNEIDRDVKWGAGIGGILGVALGFMFPLAGLAIGAAGGALVGKLIDRGLDRSFVNEVSQQVQSGSSALIVAVDDGSVDALRAAYGPFKGRVLQTSLDPEIEAEINNALK